LLNVDNIDQLALTKYAREAAEFSTEGLMPHLDYALNHFGEPDVAMFDFTSLFSAQNSIRFVERCNRCLLISIVGDSLHEVAIFDFSMMTLSVYFSAILADRIRLRSRLLKRIRHSLAVARIWGGKTRYNAAHC
jgi:hypothetical protein